MAGREGEKEEQVLFSREREKKNATREHILSSNALLIHHLLFSVAQHREKEREEVDTIYLS